MKAKEICDTAASLVTGDRAATHGDMEANHACIAAVWNGYLKARRAAGRYTDLTPEDAANLMECLKIARRLTGSHNADDYIDACGYAAIAGEIGARNLKDLSADRAR